MFKSSSKEKPEPANTQENSPVTHNANKLGFKSPTSFMPKHLIKPPEAICWSDTPIMYNDYLKNINNQNDKHKNGKNISTFRNTEENILSSKINSNDDIDYNNDNTIESNENTADDSYNSEIFEPPGDNITIADNIVIDSGATTVNEDCKRHTATLKGLEAPCSESIYEKPKFETHVSADLHNYLDQGQHAFMGLRYTSYNPNTKLYMRRLVRVGLGPSDHHYSSFFGDTHRTSDVSTQTTISYDKLNYIFKAIPKYFKVHDKYKRFSLSKKNSWNCNRFVYNMAKEAGLKNIARLHNTYSAVGAGRNIIRKLRNKKFGRNNISAIPFSASSIYTLLDSTFGSTLSAQLEGVKIPWYIKKLCLSKSDYTKSVDLNLVDLMKNIEIKIKNLSNSTDPSEEQTLHEELQHLIESATSLINKIIDRTPKSNIDFLTLCLEQRATLDNISDLFGFKTTNSATPPSSKFKLYSY